MVGINSSSLQADSWSECWHCSTCVKFIR